MERVAVKQMAKRTNFWVPEAYLKAHPEEFDEINVVVGCSCHLPVIALGNG
jgi:hypothetical protein